MPVDAHAIVRRYDSLQLSESHVLQGKLHFQRFTPINRRDADPARRYHNAVLEMPPSRKANKTARRGPTARSALDRLL